MDLYCRLNVPVARLSTADAERLKSHPWPGNVRELQHVIERAADAGIVPEAEMRRREKENIEAALERSGGKIYGRGGAADLPGMKPTTLISRMKAAGIAKAE